MLTLLSLGCPVSRSSLERSYRGCQSHPNPLGLTGPESDIYPRNRQRQTHFSYLKCFQDLSLAKGAFFSKKIVKCVQAVPIGPVETEDRHAVRPDRHCAALRNNCTKPVNPMGLTLSSRGGRENAKNIHTPKARMSHGISEISQKWGLDRKPECPLGSTKGGLHRRRERRVFGRIML